MNGRFLPPLHPCLLLSLFIPKQVTFFFFFCTHPLHGGLLRRVSQTKDFPPHLPTRLRGAAYELTTPH